MVLFHAEGAGEQRGFTQKKLVHAKGAKEERDTKEDHAKSAKEQRNFPIITCSKKE
jgi:hypothetical protein